jgi:cell division septation protein DedD
MKTFIKGYKKIIPIIIIPFLVIIYACSASDTSEEKKIEQTDDKYIFDEVPDSDVLKFESPEESTSKSYVIQIGAFSTKERAERFAEKSKIFFNIDFTVSFNSEVKLFVVRTVNAFNSRPTAEQILNEFWQYDDYDDAWIVTLTK